MCLVTCQKSFLCSKRIAFASFQKMSCSLRGRRSTLETSIVSLRGKRSTFDVSSYVFFANRIVRAAWSGDNVQIPWQAWHFVRCDENWRKPRTKHRFWGRFVRKLVGKRWFWSYKVWKLEVSYMSSLASLVFFCPRRVCGGSCSVRGRRRTSWHSHVSANVSTVVLCGKRNKFASFSDNGSHLFGKRST